MLIQSKLIQNHHSLHQANSLIAIGFAGGAGLVDAVQWLCSRIGY